MRPTRWRRSTHVLIGVAVLLVVAAVVAVAAFVTSGGPSTSAAEAIKPQPPLATPQPGVTTLADSAPKPTPDRLAATLAPFVADPNLGILTGRVTDALTGAQLWAQGAGRADAARVDQQGAHRGRRAAGASTATRRWPPRCSPTRTTLDSSSSRAAGIPRCRPPRPARRPGTATRPGSAISSRQVRDAGVAVTTVQVDISAYSGPTMAPGWDPLDIQERRHRPDGVGHARRRAHPAGQRRLVAVRHPGARRGPRAGQPPSA